MYKYDNHYCFDLSLLVIISLNNQCAFVHHATSMFNLAFILFLFFTIEYFFLRSYFEEIFILTHVLHYNLMQRTKF